MTVYTLCTSGAIVIAAGNKVNSSAASSGAIVGQFYEDAEGRICADSRINWVGIYSSLTSGAKLILSEAVSNLAATKLIAYDMADYTGRGEAEDMINLLNDHYLRCLDILKDDKNKTYLGV